ncbi:MAG: hypothetical protein MJ157_00515 [Clostridia bacterium]|nr:hypothetical protein [Clostridia bacterium]
MRGEKVADYGVTATGFVRKRLDEILEELHEDLSAGFGFNTRLNPQSYLNVLLTNFGDKIAELWEVAENVYQSMYPSMAEGQNLDWVAQYAGVIRQPAAKTRYPIYCTGVDGTEIAAGTRLASATNPVNYFLAAQNSCISRNSFTQVSLGVAALQNSAFYQVTLDQTLFSYTSSADASAQEILAGLKALIGASSDFTADLADNDFLLLQAVNPESSHVLTLSENLTTIEVTSLLTFVSEEDGEIILPAGTITNIITAVSGLNRVSNSGNYLAGRLQESDAELRKSYLDKIFALSSRMTESIESNILENCSGVKSVRVYENCGSTPDAEGRPPHSIEAVVEGGTALESAQEMLKTKAGGINTYGLKSDGLTLNPVSLTGEYGEEIVLYYTVPQNIYCWFSVKVEQFSDEDLSAGYAQIIKDILIAYVQKLPPASRINPQKCLAEIYGRINGLQSLSITLYTSSDPNAAVNYTDFTAAYANLTARQKPQTEAGRIQVTLL